MELSPDEWKLVLIDPATNYGMRDYGAAITEQSAPQPDMPVLIVDAEHLETGVVMRQTIRIPPALVDQLAVVFTEMAVDLRQRGALT